MPLGVLVEAPADVAHAHPTRIVETFHVGLDQIGIEAAPDIGNPAILDRIGDGVAYVNVLRQQDVARSDDDGAVDAVIVATGEDEPGRPVVPAAGLVGACIFGDGGIGVELVSDIGAVRRGNAHDLRLESSSPANSTRSRNSFVGSMRARTSGGSTAVRMRVPAA